MIHLWTSLPGVMQVSGIMLYREAIQRYIDILYNAI